MEQVRGVNLGGWLVLEKWLTPSLFKDVEALDEYEFCDELGTRAPAVLKKHRDNWITEDDFAWLADHGLNTVRLPVGYWLFDNQTPFIAAVEYVDKAFQWAKRYGLKIILDVHGAPGSQNGNDHSGRKGPIDWPDPENVSRTLTFIEQLSERYGHHANLLAIELLNEPSDRIAKDQLIRFYHDGYAAVRRHAPNAAVIISDAWQPAAWDKVMTESNYHDVWLDVHLYQVFSKDDQKRSMFQHIQQAGKWSEEIARLKPHPLIVGEWSLALPERAYRGMGDFDRDKAQQAYARAQLKSFASTRGWCYWTYKTEDGGAWSLRDCITRGWLPHDFGEDLVQ